MSIRKKYLASKNVCKVTFTLPKAAVSKANSVCLVGDFNGWNKSVNPMKRLRNGDYTVTMELGRGREYEFRYLIDGTRWENDWYADKYIPSPHPYCDNSVIEIP